MKKILVFSFIALCGFTFLFTACDDSKATCAEAAASYVSIVGGGDVAGLTATCEDESKPWSQDYITCIADAETTPDIEECNNLYGDSK